MKNGAVAETFAETTGQKKTKCRDIGRGRKTERALHYKLAPMIEVQTKVVCNDVVRNL